MFKNKIILSICLATFIGSAHAEPRDFGLAKLPEAPKNSQFAESDHELPAVPNPNAGEWLELYVNETHKGKAKILLDSLTLLPDGSLRYLLNNQSASGYDNITAEGMVCAEGIFNSDGMLQKTFAYADLSNQRWIVARNSKWQVLGSKRNAADPVRRVLYEVVCADNKVLNVKQLRQFFIEQAGRRR